MRHYRQAKALVLQRKVEKKNLLESSQISKAYRWMMMMLEVDEILSISGIELNKYFQRTFFHFLSSFLKWNRWVFLRNLFEFSFAFRIKFLINIKVFNLSYELFAFCSKNYSTIKPFIKPIKGDQKPLKCFC